METILVVDDDIVLLGLICEILKSEHTIIQASSGEEAIEKCKDRKTKITLAIFDFDMPGINGIEAAKIIWEKYKIPFIIMSRFDDNKIVSEAIKIGALNYLLKPLKFNDLRTTVNTSIARSKEYKSLRAESDKVLDIVFTLNQNRKYLKSIISNESKERKNIVNILHDEVGLKNNIIRNTIDQISKLSSSPEIDEKCIFAIDQLQELYKTIRQIMMKLRPEILDCVVIGQALVYLVEIWSRSNESIQADISKMAINLSLKEPLDIILYQSLQEILTNISKYSNATEVKIEFKETIKGVKLVVIDDGKGFDVSKTPLGIGLSGIREKTMSHDGIFNLTSQIGMGVKIEVLLPIKEYENSNEL